MRGVLVVNGYLTGRKYDEIHAMLIEGFRVRGITLRVVRNAELFGRDFREDIGCPNENFVLFWDKDICLARRLENAGFRVFNGSKAIEICDDKAKTELAFESAGIARPKTLIPPFTYDNIGYTNLDFLEWLTLPLVLKETKSSFGWGAYLFKGKAELQAKVKELGKTPFILQEYIECGGTDYRLQVVGDKVVAAVKRTAAAGDFRANVTNGGKMETVQKSAVPYAEMENLAVAACGAVGADFGGVDFVLGGGKPYVLEVNSNAHFKNLLETTGINVAPLLADYIRKMMNDE